MHLIAGWSGPRLVIEHDVLEVDMRLLVHRLQGLAVNAGAELRDGVVVTGWETPGVLATSEGPMPSRWVLDASGVRSAGLIPRPEVPAEHLCVAAQAVFECADPQAAEGWFRDQGAGFGPNIVFTGIAGGFSIVNVRSDGDEVSILTGSMAGSEKSGSQLLAAFVRDHPWIGERRFGGARVIPLRRPFDRIASDRVALLGDAASQVFSAHGSGIAAGMIAARAVADALADGSGPRGYERRWMRAHGGRFAAYDAFRRLSSALTVDDLEGLLRSGLLDPVTSRAALEQRDPPLGLRVALGKAVAAVRAPRLAARLLPILVMMARLRGLYARYPSDPGDVPRWGAEVAAVFKEQPD
jgi:flavin-dependent dehydrogenase